MKITEKLLELGFELKGYYSHMAYIFKTSRELNARFIHDFVYYEDENRFYINCHKLSGCTTITEKELLNDHNQLNTSAKDQWLEIRKELEEYKFEVYKGELR